MKFLSDIAIVFERELKQYWRWKLYLVFDTIIPILNLTIFILVWTAIIRGGFQQLGMLSRENYIEFLISGLLLWSFIDNSFGHDISHSFVREKYRRTMQYLFISPLSKLALPYGNIILPLFRSTYSTLVLLLAGFLFLNLSIQGNIFLVILIILLTFFGFSGIGLVIASLASWREDFADLSSIVSYILNIASGLVFPLEILPENIRRILMILPSSQAVYAVRAVLIKNLGIFELFPIILNLIAFATASILIALITFKFAERKAMLIGI